MEEEEKEEEKGSHQETHGQSRGKGKGVSVHAARPTRRRPPNPTPPTVRVSQVEESVSGGGVVKNR